MCNIATNLGFFMSHEKAKHKCVIVGIVWSFHVAIKRFRIIVS